MAYSRRTRNDLIFTFLALNVVGLLLVTAQFLTFCFADSLNRHAVLINLMGITIIYSANYIFSDFFLIMVPGSSTSEVAGALLYLLDSWVLLLFVSSFLALIIHLGFCMRSIFYPCSNEYEKRRTIVLIMMPYVLGLIAIGGLKPATPSDQAGSYIIVGVSMLTTVLDVILLAIFIRYRKFMRQCRGLGNGGLTLSFGIQLLVLCIVRLLLTGVGVLATLAQLDPFFEKMPTEWKYQILAWNFLLKRIHPLIIGIFFLRKDVLRLWLSCLK